MFDQHESIRADDQLDEALEEFELGWAPKDDYLRNFLTELGEGQSVQSISEFVRVDIDRRYAASLEVNLKGYFSSFPSLLADSRIVTSIAFEDYRSRRSRGLSINLDRWSWIPGIERATWFAALKDSTSGSISFLPRSQRSYVHIDEQGKSDDKSALPLDSYGPKGSRENLEPKLGARFGEFRLISVLGTGAFSTVFLATQSGLASRYVALKVVTRPLDEPTHLARLQHTGIVPLYSLHRIGKYTALCMPYCGSATLADWLANTQEPSRDGQSLVGTVRSAQMRLTAVEVTDDQPDFDSKEIANVIAWNAPGTQPLDKLRLLDTCQSFLWIAQRLIAALAHAHERGVIHGDLKPANILIRNDGEPALIDFNLSRNFQRDTDAWAGGTLPYMSPEQMQQLLGQSVQVDASADIYALGVILFELVENQLPFPRPRSQAESDIKYALEYRHEPVTISNTHATAGFKAIIQKCLSLSRQERYASAIPLLEDIEREITNRPLLHAKESLAKSQLPKLARRYPRLFSTGPIGLVSLMAVGLLSSLAVMLWKQSNIVDAESRFARFQTQSQILLADMVDPDPSRKDELLRASKDLTDDLLGYNTRANQVPKEKQLSSETRLKWLDQQDRTAAETALKGFCLATVSLTRDSANDLSDSQRNELRKLLANCTAATTSSSTTSSVFKNLEELVENKAADVASQLASIEANDQAFDLVELLRARLDAQQGNLRNASDRLRSIEPHNTPNHLYWMVSGDVQMGLDQRDAAIQAYGLAIAAVPQSAAAYVKRAQVFQSLADFKSAEQDYSHALRLAPSSASLYMKRALVRQSLKKYDEAILDMDASLKLDPDSNSKLFVRANLHRLAQHPIEYRKDFSLGMTSAPKVLDDWISRALAKLPKSPDEAKLDLQEALRIDPNSATALQNLAHVESEHLHDMDASIAALDQILQSNPMNDGARAGRGVLLARMGQVDKCLEDLDYLSQRESKLPPSTVYQMGCAYALISTKKAGCDEIALQLLARALRRGYGAEYIETDPDVDAVREHPSFEALLTFVKLNQTN